MSRTQKIVNIIFGLFTIILGILMVIPKMDSYLIVLQLLELSMVLYGLRLLYYYFSMARYMVGGIYIFFKGVLILDAGLFTANVDNLPSHYAMLYLIVGMAFSGLLSVLRALDAKKIHSTKWKSSFIYGLVEILTAVVCLFFLNNQNVLVLIYGIGLMNAGRMRIVSALRKTEIVYVN